MRQVSHKLIQSEALNYQLSQHHEKNKHSSCELEIPLVLFHSVLSGFDLSSFYLIELQENPLLYAFMIHVV